MFDLEEEDLECTHIFYDLEYDELMLTSCLKFLSPEWYAYIGEL